METGNKHSDVSQLHISDGSCTVSEPEDEQKAYFSEELADGGERNERFNKPRYNKK